MEKLRNGDENASFIFFEGLSDVDGRVGYIRDPDLARAMVAAFNSSERFATFSPFPTVPSQSPAAAEASKGSRPDHVWIEKYLDAFKKTYKICNVCNAFYREGSPNLKCRGPRKVTPRTSTGKKLPE